MRFIIDTEKKLITVYGNSGLKEMANTLVELSEKGFDGYSLHAIPLLDFPKQNGTFGYVSTDTLTVDKPNEPVIPPIYL